MTALADNRNTPEIYGENPVGDFTVLDTEICYAGGIAALDENLEIQAAGDTLGLRVIGRFPLEIDNTNDGESAETERGIFRYENSSSAAITQAMIGEVCYVEDDQTVAAGSTNLVAAGIVHDVDGNGVWVDQRAAALALARKNARPKVVAVTSTTSTLTAAQCNQGNVVVTADNASGVTLTLPTAVAGYRVGIQRIAATAAHDVVVTAAASDTVRGSTAAGTVTNDTDAVSDILWLETANATNWTDAFPLAKDRAEWTAST